MRRLISLSIFSRKAIILLFALNGFFFVSCNDTECSKKHTIKSDSARLQISYADSIPDSISHIQSFDDIDSADLHLIDSLLSLSPYPGSIVERINLFSKCFLGLPYYDDGPTGEGRYDTIDTAPIYNFHCFDCVTYIEHVIALALSKDASSFLPNLLKLRYKNCTIDYVHRNHYFVTDWLENNRDIAVFIHPDNEIKIARTISKKNFFARKQHLKVHIPDTVATVSAWSVEGLMDALVKNSLMPGIYIMIFIKKHYRSVISNHVGFAIIDSNSAILRDASKIRGRVAETNLRNCLIRNAPVLEGLLIAQVKEGSDPRQPINSANRAH